MVRDFDASEGAVPVVPSRPAAYRREVVMGDVVHGDKVGGDKVAGDKVVHAPGGGPARSGRHRRVILVLSANADAGQVLRVDRERREIDDEIRYAQAGDRLSVEYADAVRRQDLHRALLRHDPVIAHFSGHGTRSQGIVLMDGDGRPRMVPPAALSNLFKILGGRLRCVVLNACYSAEQAEAIAEHVPCVVGMRSRVGDDAAIRFAAGFYSGIASAQSVRTAYELGVNQLELDGHPDADVPVLHAAPGQADRPVIGRV